MKTSDGFATEAAKRAMASWFAFAYMCLNFGAIWKLLQGISIDSTMYFGRHRRGKCS